MTPEELQSLNDQFFGTDFKFSDDNNVNNVLIISFVVFLIANHYCFKIVAWKNVIISIILAVIATILINFLKSKF